MQDLDNTLLEVDGNKTTLREFIHDNTAPDVEFQIEDIHTVLKLELWQVTFIGSTEIKRVQ